MKGTETNGSSRSLCGNHKVDRVALLEKLAERGSITAAAKALGVSYKGAWEAIEALNNLSDAPLVERTVGGTGGGGTRLTKHGEKVLSRCCATSTPTSRDSSPPSVAAAAASTGSTIIFNSCGDGI